MPFDSPSPADPHPDWHDLLAGYALGNLSSEERATLQQLLTDQPELKAELQAYQETLALVPYALEPHPLPTKLEEAIMAAARAPNLSPPEFTPEFTPESTPDITPGLPPDITPALTPETAANTAPETAASRALQPGGRWYRRRPWYAMAAAVLVATVVGVDNYRLRQQQTRLQAQLATTQAQLQDRETQLTEATAVAEAMQAEQVIDILRQPNALVYSLQGTGDAATSSGSLLTLPDHSEVQLVSHNLPVLPAGQVYRLWSVATAEAAPMFCGQFNNTEVGTVQWTVPDALCNATPVQVIITIDAVVDPPVPKGPAVLTGSI